MKNKDLLTIFNYPNKLEYNLMFHTWLRMANKHSNGFNIKVLSSEEPNEYIEKLKETYDFEWVICDHYSGELFNEKDPIFSKHNVTFKLWNIYKNENPFIFVDVDAFILKDINEMWKYKDDKPFIGINHQFIPMHTENEPYPFLNSGVLLVSEPSFIDYEKIMKERGRLLCKGYDQAILFSHFKKIGYDYTHPNIGHEWNSCAGYCELFKNNDIWEGKTINLKNHNHNIYINHYWDEFKPWRINCPIYNETKEIDLI